MHTSNYQSVNGNGLLDLVQISPNGVYYHWTT